MEISKEIQKTMTDEDWANVIDVLPHPNSTCRACEYRRENYPRSVPAECRDCGYLSERDEPDFVGLPVYKEGYISSAARKRLAELKNDK